MSDYSVILSKEFDESKHPRGEHGRFGHEMGGSSASSVSEESGSVTLEQKTRTRRVIDGAKKAWNSAKPVLAFTALLFGPALAALAIGAALEHAFPSKPYRGVYGSSDEATRARARAQQRQRERDQQEARGEYRGQETRSRGTTVEDPAQTKVRMEHGIKASHIMALYLRAGTLGEKDAAHAALVRMGIDPAKYAKMLLKASQAEMKAAFAALDHLITENEADAILNALLDTMSADDAQKILDNAGKIGPDLRKVNMNNLVKEWSGLANSMRRIDVSDLATRWLVIGETLAKTSHYDPGQPRDDHGRWSDEGGHRSSTFISGGGEGAGGPAYGSKDKPWRDMNDKGERIGRYKQLLSELHTMASDVFNPRQEWAEEKLARLNELKTNHEGAITDDERKRAWQSLMQSVGDIHDNERRKDQARPLTEAERLARAGDQLLQQASQPGRGTGDNFATQQNNQRINEERAAAQRRADEARRTQQAGQPAYTQADKEAVDREVARVKAARETADFEARFARATESVARDNQTRSIMTGIGNTLGHAARSTYYAQELVRGLAGGTASALSGNYLEAGRALMDARSDLSQLRSSLSGLSSEGAFVVSRALRAINGSVKNTKEGLDYAQNL